MKYQYLKKGHLLPGKMVSEDQYILQAPDMLYHTKGKSYPYEMFSGGFLLTMPVVI